MTDTNTDSTGRITEFLKRYIKPEGATVTAVEQNAVRVVLWSGSTISNFRILDVVSMPGNKEFVYGYDVEGWKEENAQFIAVEDINRVEYIEPDPNRIVWQ